MSKKNLALLLIGNSVLLIGLYFLLLWLDLWFITYVYVALGTAMTLWFIIYNRGFYAKNATPDQLPSTMTKQEKLDYIQNGKELLKKSRWMLTVILPIVLAIALDLVYLFIFPYLKEIFS